MILLNKSKSKARWIFASLILLLTTLATSFAISHLGFRDVSAGGPSQEVSPFDPYLAAMRMSTPEDLKDIQHAQVVAANLRDSNPTVADEIDNARQEAFDAIDTLYEEIRLDPNFDAARKQWQSCMELHGTPAMDPGDVERQLATQRTDAADPTPPDLNFENGVVRSETPFYSQLPDSVNRVTEPSAANQKIITNEELCDRLMRTVADEAVKSKFPSWLRVHSGVFERYRALLMQLIGK